MLQSTHSCHWYYSKLFLSHQIEAGLRRAYAQSISESALHSSWRAGASKWTAACFGTHSPRCCRPLEKKKEGWKISRACQNAAICRLLRNLWSHSILGGKRSLGSKMYCSRLKLARWETRNRIGPTRHHLNWSSLSRILLQRIDTGE